MNTKPFTADLLAGYQNIVTGAPGVGDFLVEVNRVDSLPFAVIAPEAFDMGDDGLVVWRHRFAGDAPMRLYRKGNPPKAGDTDICPGTGKPYAENRDPSPAKHYSDPSAKASEMPPSREAADMVELIARLPKGSKFVGNIHDEFIFEAPQGKLPTAAAARKGVPIATGVLDYFPDAIAYVAKVSKAGNEQHHPGTPLHWDKSKSTDEADALVRHLIDRGTLDTDGLRHSGKVAWRALALLQRELDGVKGGAK